jgi:predicted transport protein
VYKASENVSAPDKLLFEVSINPRDSKGLMPEQIAGQLNRLSRDSLAEGVLDRLGTEIFTTGKVRKALDRLFVDAPASFVRLIRKSIGDDSVTPSQIRQALGRIWDVDASGSIPTVDMKTLAQDKPPAKRPVPKYTEGHHTEGKPSEVIELYRGLDRVCHDLAPGQVTRAYKAKYVSWSLGKNIFCCAHLQQNGLRIWVKLSPKTLDPSISFARDVSKIGHWGVGDVELAIDRLERLRDAEPFIQKSFGNATQK